MSVVDEDGRLFGYINIIDAAAVLLVVAIVAGSGAWAYAEMAPAPQPTPAEGTVTLTLRTEQPPYKAEAIQHGAPLNESVVVVSEPTVARVPNGTANATADLRRVELTLRYPDVPINQRPRLHGQELYVGQRVTIEWTNTRFEGTVIAMDVQRDGA